MKIREHQMPLFCLNCDKQTQVVAIWANGKGTLVFETVCVACTKNFEFKTDFLKVITQCLELDLLFPLEQQFDKEGDEKET